MSTFSQYVLATGAAVRPWPPPLWRVSFLPEIHTIDSKTLGQALSDESKYAQSILDSQNERVKPMKPSRELFAEKCGPSAPSLDIQENQREFMSKLLQHPNHTNHNYQNRAKQGFNHSNCIKDIIDPMDLEDKMEIEYESTFTPPWKRRRQKIDEDGSWMSSRPLTAPAFYLHSPFSEVKKTNEKLQIFHREETNPKSTPTSTSFITESSNEKLQIFHREEAKPKSTPTSTSFTTESSTHKDCLFPPSPPSAPLWDDSNLEKKKNTIKAPGVGAGGPCEPTRPSTPNSAPIINRNFERRPQFLTLGSTSLPTRSPSSKAVIPQLLTSGSTSLPTRSPNSKAVIPQVVRALPLKRACSSVLPLAIVSSRSCPPSEVSDKLPTTFCSAEKNKVTKVQSITKSVSNDCTAIPNTSSNPPSHKLSSGRKLLSTLSPKMLIEDTVGPSTPIIRRSDECSKKSAADFWRKAQLSRKYEQNETKNSSANCNTHIDSSKVEGNKTAAAMFWAKSGQRNNPKTFRSYTPSIYPKLTGTYSGGKRRHSAISGNNYNKPKSKGNNYQNPKTNVIEREMKVTNADAFWKLSSNKTIETKTNDKDKNEGVDSFDISFSVDCDVVNTKTMSKKNSDGFEIEPKQSINKDMKKEINSIDWKSEKCTFHAGISKGSGSKTKHLNRVYNGKKKLRRRSIKSESKQKGQSKSRVLYPTRKSSTSNTDNSSSKSFEFSDDASQVEWQTYCAEFPPPCPIKIDTKNNIDDSNSVSENKGLIATSVNCNINEQSNLDLKNYVPNKKTSINTNEAGTIEVSTTEVETTETSIDKGEKENCHETIETEEVLPAINSHAQKNVSQSDGVDTKSNTESKVLIAISCASIVSTLAFTAASSYSNICNVSIGEAKSIRAVQKANDLFEKKKAEAAKLQRALHDKQKQIEKERSQVQLRARDAMASFGVKVGEWESSIRVKLQNLETKLQRVDSHTRTLRKKCSQEKLQHSLQSTTMENLLAALAEEKEKRLAGETKQREQQKEEEILRQRRISQDYEWRKQMLERERFMNQQELALKSSREKYEKQKKEEEDRKIREKKIELENIEKQLELKKIEKKKEIEEQDALKKVENKPHNEMMDHTSASMCVVCLACPELIALLPCGHRCCCSVCGLQLSSCPICRTKIRQRTRIFDAGYRNSPNTATTVET